MNGGGERDRLRDVAAAFRDRFRSDPTALVRAPGRVNLIGEHTDYNDGFVLPMAIDREVRIALRPRADRRVRVVALDLASDYLATDNGEEAEFSLAELERGHGWVEYLKGVAWSLAREGHVLHGFDGVVSGNVPRGAGLSSSAALELATARAFYAVSRFEWEPDRIALACQRAENEWLGVNTGIMDQLASAAGREGHALLIDCRTLITSAVPLPPDTTVLVLDTTTRRGLVGSAYNERREQCESAARTLGARSLRDVSQEQFDAASAALNPLLRRRARHVVSENARTLAAAAAMREGDAALLGELMDQSHKSLRDDFEVSTSELDKIVACARSQPGCYGARLTGAGFGGCAVALVSASAAPAIAAGVLDCYRTDTGLEARAYLCRPSSGTGEVNQQ
ncbi:MAG: galactokinase [Trueperaceae bacterium]